MRSEIDYLLDGLLADWYKYSRGYRMTRGFSNQDSTCRDYRAPGHWDWQNGASDEKAEKMVMRAVNDAIDRVPNDPRRWNTAIQFEARNLHCGYSVWISPHLPRDKAEREVLVLEARTRLLIELRKGGVVG